MDPIEFCTVGKLSLGVSLHKKHLSVAQELFDWLLYTEPLGLLFTPRVIAPLASALVIGPIKDKG